MLPLVIPIFLLLVMGIEENIAQPGSGVIHFFQLFYVLAVLMTSLKFPKVAGFILLFTALFITAMDAFVLRINTVQPIFVIIVLLLPILTSGLLLIFSPDIHFPKHIKPHHR